MHAEGVLHPLGTMQIIARHAAGFVVRRLATRNDRANITSVNSASTAKLALSEKPVEADPGKSSERRASVPYVSGLISMTARSHMDAPESGNSDPDNNHNGMRKRLMMA